MLAIFWNWNHRFFGTNDNGVYLAVRILLRVYCCAGLPSSSRNCSGSGRLKYSCRGPVACSSSSSTASVCWVSLSCCDCNVVEPPDCLFFSLWAKFSVCRLIKESRFMLLLLTVNFRVAHLDRFVLSIFLLSGLLLPLLIVPSSASDGVCGAIVRQSRAGPDQAQVLARLVGVGVGVDDRPTGLECKLPFVFQVEGVLKPCRCRFRRSRVGSRRLGRTIRTAAKGVTWSGLCVVRVVRVVRVCGIGK